MTREELLQRIDSGRAELESTLARVPAGRMLEPALTNGWSVKDMLAHLGAWEARAETLYRLLSAGQEVEGTADFNEFNAQTYAANRDKPLEVIRESEREAFERLRAVAETAPEADLFEPARFAWTQGKEFFYWIGWNSYEHYAEHLPDLHAWLEKEGGSISL